MQTNHLIVMLYLFFVNSYAQQQAPVLELRWIDGLSEDIAHTILLAIVKVAESDKVCIETLQNLSYVTKQWNKLVQPEENKVCQTLNAKHIKVHKSLGIALSEKFNLTPALAVALGTDVLLQQLDKSMEAFNNRINDFPSIKYADSPWLLDCLSYAIRKNKKYMVNNLCAFGPNVNEVMDIEGRKIPLLAGAILYNHDENDLAIIDCLLKSGANVNEKFTFTNKNNPTFKRGFFKVNSLIFKVNTTEYPIWLGCTPLLLAKEQNKLKIVAKLNKYSK